MTARFATCGRGGSTGPLCHHRTGTSAYRSRPIVLASLTPGLPKMIGDGGTYASGQVLPIIVVALYAFSCSGRGTGWPMTSEKSTLA